MRRSRPDPSGGNPRFVPTPVADLELARTSDPPRRNERGAISVLVRVHGVPLGVLSLTGSDSERVEDLEVAAAERFHDGLVAHLAADGLHSSNPLTTAREHPVCPRPTSDGGGLVTVVVCSLGADPRLRETVQSILAQSHRELELVVVCNRPTSTSVDTLLAGVDDPRLRIVLEPCAGLSAARNAGLAAAHGRVVAFTDDDAYADPEWLRQLLAPFSQHYDVVCVTGLVLPAELATPAQVWFEEFGAFDKGFERLVWARGVRQDLDVLGERGTGGVLFPYSAGVFGSGNNMAFDTAWLRSARLFDEALGAGALTRGGEDLDGFLTVMLAGRVLVYEPRAVVRHYGRRDVGALRTQMFGYGSGMSAVIVKHFVASPRNAVGIIARLPAGLRKLLHPGSEKNVGRVEFPRELARAELRGYAAGPILYVRSRRAARRRRRADPLTDPA